jgi:salicylate hydroxylase
MKAMAKPNTVMIVGGGLGGLTLAVALLRRGFTVRVFEQAAELKEVGAGLTLPATAMRVFDDIGVWPAVREVSTHGASVAFVHYQTGELLHGAHDRTWTRKPESPDVGAHAHRSAVHALLVDAVRALDPNALHLNHRLVAVRDDGAGVEAEFADGSRARGDLLVGADGVRSSVYRAVFRRDNPATFTGVMAIRCLMPIDARIEPFLSGGRAVNYVGPGRGFHRYGIQNGTVLNCVALATTDAWTEEGWSHRCPPAEFLSLYGDFHPDVLGLIAAAPPDSTFKWALYAREPIERWSKGRVTLLGDAAHPMLPYLGQGATAAIEDALVLARALESQPDLAAGLDAYEAERRRRTTEQMRLSKQQGEALNRGPEAYAANRPDQAKLSSYDPRRARV